MDGQSSLRPLSSRPTKHAEAVLCSRCSRPCGMCGAVCSSDNGNFASGNFPHIKGKQLPRKSTEDSALPEENPSFKGTAPSSVFPSARVADVRIATSPEDDVRNVISGMDGCLSSRVADARSNERPLHSTSQPANVAQRNRVPEETDARTVITSFDIVMGTAKVEEHELNRTIQWQSQESLLEAGRNRFWLIRPKPRTIQAAGTNV